MAAAPPGSVRDATMDATSLYREEIYTDRAAATLRVLVPVTKDGTPDSARETVYMGEAQILTNMGPLPINFEIDASKPRRRHREVRRRREGRASKTRCANCRRCGGRRRRRSSSRRAACPISAAAGRSSCRDARPGLRAIRAARPGTSSPRTSSLRGLGRQCPVGGGEALDQEIGERAHLGRQVAAAGVHDVDAGGCRRRNRGSNGLQTSRRARPAPR